VLKNAELDALEAHMDFEIWCRTSQLARDDASGAAW
jgi:hypothetical protein